MPGNFCVLQTDDRRIDLSVASPIVSRVLGLQSLDAGRALVESSGVIWQDLEQEVAERLAAELTAGGIGAVARDWTTLRMPGETYDILKAQFKDDIFHVHGKGFEREIRYREIVLLTCGRVKGGFETDRIRSGVVTVSSGYGAYSNYQASQQFQTLQKRKNATSYLNIFATNPDETFQVESQGFKYPTLGIRLGYSTFDNFARLTRELTNRTQDVITNLGVDLLLNEGGDWGDVTFDSPEEFRRHNIWMLQLVS